MLVLVIGDTVLVVLLGLLVAGLLRSHADILRALRDLGAPVGDPAAPGDPTSAGATHRGPGANRALGGDVGHGGHGPGAPVPFRRAGDGTLQMGPPLPEGRGSHVGHDVSGETPSGDAVAVAVLDVPQATLLAFLSSGCTGCAQFWDALQGGGAGRVPAGVRPIIVVKGPEAEHQAAVRQRSTGSVPVVMSSDAWGDYEVPGSPFFVLVDGPSGRRLGEGTAASFEQVLGLVSRAMAEGPAGVAEAAGRAGAAAEGHPGGAAVGRAGGAVGERPARQILDAGRDSPERVDAELRAAGILPGDPSLHPHAVYDVLGDRHL